MDSLKPYLKAGRLESQFILSLCMCGKEAPCPMMPLRLDGLVEEVFAFVITQCNNHTMQGHGILAIATKQIAERVPLKQLRLFTMREDEVEDLTSSLQMLAKRLGDQSVDKDQVRMSPASRAKAVGPGEGGHWSFTGRTAAVGFGWGIFIL